MDDVGGHDLARALAAHMASLRPATSTVDVLDDLQGESPLGRFTHVDEVAWAVTLLLDDTDEVARMLDTPMPAYELNKERLRPGQGRGHGVLGRGPDVVQGGLPPGLQESHRFRLTSPDYRLSVNAVLAAVN